MSRHCCTIWWIFSLGAIVVVVAAGNNANLPPPPPKIPFHLEQQQQQQHQEQMRQQQQRLPPQPDGILPPPPPPLNDEINGDLSNDQATQRRQAMDRNEHRDATSFLNKPREVQQQARQLPSSLDVEAIKSIIPPPPVHHPPPEKDAMSLEQPSSFGVEQQHEATPSFIRPSNRAATFVNHQRDDPSPLTENVLSSNNGGQLTEQLVDRPPPPQQQQHLPDFQSVNTGIQQRLPNYQSSKTGMGDTLLPRQQPPLGQAGGMPRTQQQQQQQSSMLPPPRFVSQQQQQQRLPPPRQGASVNSGRRLPPPQFRNAVKPATGLQALWKRVEKGLDNLAELEDQFSSGAQRIASSALQSTMTWRRQQQPEQQQYQRPPPQQQGNLPLNQRDRTTASQTQPLRDPRGPPAVISVTKVYHKDESQQLATDDVNGTAVTGDTIRSTRWNNIMTDKRNNTITDKMQKVALRSNGGASQPQLEKAAGASASLMPPSQPGAGGASVINRRLPPGEGQQQRWPLQTSEQQQQPPWSRSAPYLQDAPATTNPPPHTTDGQRTSRPFPGGFPEARRGPPGGPGRVMAPKRRSLYEDDDEQPSFLSRLGKMLPPIPRFPSLFRNRSFRQYEAASLDIWKDDDDESRQGKGIFFGLFRKQHNKRTIKLTASRDKKSSHLVSSQLAPPLGDLMDRCDHGKTASLLSRSETRICRSIGNSRAALDVVCLVFLLLGVHQMPNVAGIPLPFPLADMFSESLTGYGTALLFALQTWAPFAFASAYLTAQTNKILHGGQTKRLARKTADTAKEAGTYGQLYLRLTASQPTAKHIPERLQQAAHAQVVGRVEAARLRSFVSFVMAALVLMTVSVVKPIAMEVVKVLMVIATLPEWKTWPLPWKDLGSSTLLALQALYQRVNDLVARDLEGLLENPLKFAFHTSLFVVLAAVYFLPTLEHRRPIPVPSKQVTEEDGAAPSFGSVESLSNMGISSASRLQLWASGAGIEGALERWRTMLPSLPRSRQEWITRTHLRQAGYGVLIASLLSLPILVRTAVGISESIVPSHAIFQWDSVLDVAVILLFTFQLASRAMKHIVESMDTRSSVHGFLKDLSSTMEEVTSLRKSSHMDLQLIASVSPMKGLMVSDLWAAHATKRAWAVRGANFECRNGELVVVIGDDGAGKTRLITTIAESMVFPPKESMSTTKVRGLISMGGVDVTKWDKSQLKRRLGLVLNDVRTVADHAELLSGLTLEEILEPSDGLPLADPSHTTGANEKNSMILALKMTGLAASLLPRLPTKLSTVVSANEEDLKPSPLRPRCQVLSPSEWSKLLLTRVLAQCIYDNDNSARSTDKLENCLVGSLLLLDDATIHMSEVDEAVFLTTLRRTGAACVVTSNKWAAGRFADRVVVMKDGVVVESGTHSELLNRGPQHSLYASKWLAMTTN